MDIPNGYCQGCGFSLLPGESELCADCLCGRAPEPLRFERERYEAQEEKKWR